METDRLVLRMLVIHCLHVLCVFSHYWPATDKLLTV